MSVITDYTDERGVKRRVLIPDHTVPPAEGIPLSLQLDEVLKDCPPSFLARLTDEFWALGLIEPADFLKPNALRDMHSALAAAYRIDVFSIQTIAKEQTNALK